MNIFKNKSIVAYLSLLVPVLAIVLAIIGGATKGLLGDTFSWVIVLFLVLGAVVSIAAFLFPKAEMIQAVAPIFYGIALSLIFLDGVEVVSTPFKQRIYIDNWRIVPYGSEVISDFPDEEEEEEQ